MGTPGSRTTTIGFIVLLLSVSAGIHSGGGGFCSLLSLMGVLVGASLVAAGVHMAEGRAPTIPVPVVSVRARALAAFVRRNTAAVGLVMVSCACTAVSGDEEDPVLCFGMFALLQLGVFLINIGARGE